MVFKKGHKLLPEIQNKITQKLRQNPTMGFLGKQHTEEYKKYMSQKIKEVRIKKKWGGLKGNLNPTKRFEVKLKISKANKGKIRSEESKKKTGETIKKLITEGKLDRKSVV